MAFAPFLIGHDKSAVPFEELLVFRGEQYPSRFPRSFLCSGKAFDRKT